MGWNIAWRLAVYGVTITACWALAAYFGATYSLGLMMLYVVAVSNYKEMRRRHSTPIFARDLLLEVVALIVVVGLLIIGKKSDLNARFDALPGWTRLVLIGVMSLTFTWVEWRRLRTKMQPSIEHGKT